MQGYSAALLETKMEIRFGPGRDYAMLVFDRCGNYLMLLFHFPLWRRDSSENFDELTPQQGVMSAGAFSTINNTNVDIVANGRIFGYLCQPPESGNCVDMDGTYDYPGDPQGQLQSNMLFPAGSYLLSFDLIGSQRGTTASTTVTFGNYNHEFTLASTDDTSGIVVNQLVTLSSPGYLLFVSDSPDQIGDLLDNVVVSTSSRLRSRPACSSWDPRS